MRYVLLSRSRRITNPVNVFSIFIIQDLYKKFYNKEKRVIFILNKILNFLNNIQNDKISNILFLNDLNSFKVF